MFDTVWTSTDSAPGTLTVTGLDTVTHRIAGVFRFIAVPQYPPGRIIRIGQGRFRFHYAYPGSAGGGPVPARRGR